MAYSDRTYVGPGPRLGSGWVTVYYVKPSHCNLCGNLNVSYTLALYQSRSRSLSQSYISSVWISNQCKHKTLSILFGLIRFKRIITTNFVTYRPLCFQTIVVFIWNRNCYLFHCKKNNCTESFSVDFLLMISLCSCTIFYKDHQEYVVNIFPLYNIV